MTKKKKDTIKSLAIHAKDVGSTEIQIGLLTDKAVTSYKTLPHLSYFKRERIFKSLPYVKSVIKQDTLDYTKNLRLINANK